MNYLLGIDVGTSATKTVLFDENGRVTASASQEYPLYQPENGWAEQRPEDWADAVLNTIKEVISKSGAGKDDVKGIGISGQMHGLVMLDEMGEVIRPSIISVSYTHLDVYKRQVCEKLPGSGNAGGKRNPVSSDGKPDE